LVTVGAFVLAIGILLSVINFFWSLRNGAPAGKNPWNADTLEWSTDSPPPAYGSVHIPTVASRHPLWDEHEEESDPNGERILDEGRLTFTTGWLDADARALATMPEDTILPLVLAVVFFVLFLALTFKWMWLALAAVVTGLIIAAVWMWPRPEAKVI